ELCAGTFRLTGYISVSSGIHRDCNSVILSIRGAGITARPKLVALAVVFHRSELEFVACDLPLASHHHIPSAVHRNAVGVIVLALRIIEGRSPKQVAIRVIGDSQVVPIAAP